jgi:hypothetical protein
MLALLLAAFGAPDVRAAIGQEGSADMPKASAGRRAVPEDEPAGIDRERRLLDTASAIEGDSGAYLVLRLLETSALKDRDLRREGFEAVRVRMPDASEPWPLALDIGTAESREAQRFGAMGHLRADALTLRCRLALEMVRSDRRAARELLLELPPGLGVPADECRSFLMPTAEVFYETLPKVLASSLTAGELRRGVKWEIARRYLAAVGTPLDIGAASAMITALEPPAEEIELLVAQLTAAISKMPGSWRAIAQMAGNRGAGPRIEGLLERLGGREAARRELRAALRGLVERSLEAPRCADAAADMTANVLEYFNAVVLADRPLAAADIEPPARGEAGVENRLYVSAASRRILTEIKALVHERPEAESDVIRAYDACLAKVRDWSSVEERSDGDYVSQKAYILMELIRLAPDRSRRVDALSEYVAITRHAKRAETPDGVLVVQAVFLLWRLDADDRRLVLEMLRAGGPPLLAAYATLQLDGVDAFGIETPAGAR